MRTNKDLEFVLAECIEDAKRLGLEPGTVTEIVFNKRIRCLGKCYFNYCDTGPLTFYIKDFRIEVNRVYEDEEISYSALRELVMHELLHTCRNKYGLYGISHNLEWSGLARIVSIDEKYRDIFTSCATKDGLKTLLIKQEKHMYPYMGTCNKCGAVLVGDLPKEEGPYNFRCSHCCNGRIHC